MASEFNPGAQRVRVLPDGSAIVDGLALMTDVNDAVRPSHRRGTYNTIGGYVLGRLGRRARLGETIEVEGRTIRVEALDGLRVARVLIAPPRKAPPGAGREQ